MTKVGKKELVEQLAEKLDISKLKASQMFDTFVDLIVEELKKGNQVFIHGLGTFKPVDRPATERRNPQTGKIINVPPKTVLRFRPSKTVRVLS